MGAVAGWLRNKNHVVPWIYKLARNTKHTVTERDPEGSEGPRLRRGEPTTSPTHSMIEPETVQGGSTARKSKKGTLRKSSKHQASRDSV
jgi:hypothetical protein